MGDFFIIFVTTVIATALSSMSGGGASIINLPVFLWLGMSFPLATMVQKVSSTFWTIVAARNYLKGSAIDWKLIVICAVMGLAGAYSGVKFILTIDQRTLEVFVGIFILLLVFYTFTQKQLGLTTQNIHSKFRQGLVYPAMLILGFYESLFGAGNGIAFTIIAWYTRGFDFMKALGYYFAIACVWVLFIATLLISKGQVDFSAMIAATIGSVLGAYIGSRYARYKGNKFIKILFVTVGGILGTKLLLGW